MSTGYSGGEKRGLRGAGLHGPTCRLSLSETVDQAVETYGLQKITLLREISLKTGIQVGWLRAPPLPALPPVASTGPSGWGGLSGFLETWGGRLGGAT